MTPSSTRSSNLGTDKVTLDPHVVLGLGMGFSPYEIRVVRLVFAKIGEDAEEDEGGERKLLRLGICDELFDSILARGGKGEQKYCGSIIC
jgi:hypothetical protein